jgi:LAS superfamily LD-carboxypeptidase LdcB
MTQDINTLAEGVSDLQQKTRGLADSLSVVGQFVADVKQNVEGVSSQVNSFGQTINTLDKLSKTDKELLQKYSKVYFLNEHYVPEQLTQIDKAYVYSEDRTEQIHTKVWPHLKSLLDAAKGSSVELYVKSAYRSFAEQTSLKNQYSVTYGAGANRFSADQGYSEHQLGTAVDFITAGMNGELSGFDKTAAYTWMQNHAYEYGFILSYAPGNAYYMFEPWHWRYVGVKLATYLHTQNKSFYNADQREIDTYLINIFD